MKFVTCFLPLALIALLINCTKKIGTNTALAYSNKALFDSCRKEGRIYYKNNPNTLLPGTGGPHGTFKLRFNATAFAALTDNGKLPTGKKMPDGSFIIKDVYTGGQLTLYAFMYKISGSWIWGEIKENGQVFYSVDKNPETCISCHSQAGNRDLVATFKYY